MAEELYLKHGSFANAFSVAFDPDLERHWWNEQGLISYWRQPLAKTSVAFFDPLCADADQPAALDDFLLRTKSKGDRVAWWKASEPIARLLAERGYFVCPYGIEHTMTLPVALSGTKRRGLRRQVNAARSAGLVIEAADAADADDGLWEELRGVSRRWLTTRPQPYEARRVTRRTPHRVEPHSTKVLARDRDGQIVGWAALDHLQSGNRVLGCGLNAVRCAGSRQAPGAATLLAIDGSMLVRQRCEMLGSTKPGDAFHLALGESPLPRRASLSSFDIAASLRTAQSVEQLFDVIRVHGRWLYNVQGISDWKSKWRADRQAVTYIAVESATPLREALAVVSSLIL